jgi:glycerol-3-phosphate dehydrogenase
VNRDFDSLRQGPFDLLVIGGGIYGAWIAYDAALRGLHVALVERTDWAAGTSSASTKLIHGGLRYLEQLHLGLVRRALSERRRLHMLAPHRVHPLRFVVPIYRGDRVGPLRLEAGLWLYDRLAGPDQPVPPHRSFGRAELLAHMPFLAPDGLKAGFAYGDCGTDDARLTLEVVAGALNTGAICVNGADVVELIREGDRTAGAVVLDRETGGSADVRATMTVNAAGPWGERLKGLPPEAAGLTRLVKGVHLVLPPMPTDDALLMTARRDGRVFFAIPWYGNTLLGTTDDDYQGDPGSVAVEAADEEYLLSAAHRFLGGLGWTEADVRGRFAGVRTLRKGKDARPSDVTREWSLEALDPGLLMPIGGKLTAARAEASLTVQEAMNRMDRPPGTCPTKRRAFPWRPVELFDHWREEAAARGHTLGLDPETAALTPARFGTSLARLHGLLQEDVTLARRIVADAPFCMGEALHAVRFEMAGSLADVLRRRIPLAILRPLQRPTLEAVAALIGPELGWNSARREAEVQTFLEHGPGPRP